MNKEEKTLLNIQLFLQYYKNDNILDRYRRIIESGIIFDNEILNEMQPNIYVIKYNKYIKLKKEIDRLNNIIDELEKYINKTKLEEFEKVYGKRYGKTFTQTEVIVCNMILDKLKALKENK